MLATLNFKLSLAFILLICQAHISLSISIVQNSDSYNQFLKLLHILNVNSQHFGCLFGEFYSDEGKYFPPQQSQTSYLTVRFVLKFNKQSAYNVLLIHRKISNHIRKHTQNCYMQFHHVDS